MLTLSYVQAGLYTVLSTKSKVKQPYLTSITRDSNSTDKPEVDGALILLPPRHQCSVLRVFKATQATQNGKKSKHGCEIRNRTQDLLHQGREVANARKRFASLHRDHSSLQ